MCKVEHNGLPLGRKNLLRGSNTNDFKNNGIHYNSLSGVRDNKYSFQ